MKRTPRGTPVGVDDPLEVVERCDWVTPEGLCRLAIAHPDVSPAFAAERRAEGHRCPVVDADRPWTDCDEFTSLDRGRRCARCGLESRPMAHDASARPLLEAHHLAYPEVDGAEVTVVLCRWCHARVHAGDARVDDDADPDRAALAALARRKRTEREETFSTAAERRGPD